MENFFGLYFFPHLTHYRILTMEERLWCTYYSACDFLAHMKLFLVINDWKKDVYNGNSFC